MFICYAIKKKKYAPFINAKGETLDTGEPQDIKLWESDNEKIIKIFLENLKNGSRAKDFKFWVKEI
jgi:hypothetical protein